MASGQLEYSGRARRVRIVGNGEGLALSVEFREAGTGIGKTDTLLELRWQTAAVVGNGDAKRSGNQLGRDAQGSWPGVGRDTVA